MSDFFSKLSSDLPKLVESGVVTKAAAGKLLAHYRNELEESRTSKLVPILSILGSVFVGVGFILYFAANWETFSDWGKLALLTAATVSVYAAAYALLFVRNFPKTGHALALLASILYGASIFLIGQTFNLGGTFSEALLLWLAGVVPVAYVTGLASFPVLISFLLGGWMLAQASERSSWYYVENMLVWWPSVLGLFLVGISVWHADRYPSFRAVYSRLGSFAIFSGIFLFTFDGVLNNYRGGWSYVATLFAAFAGVGVSSYLSRIAVRRDFSRDSLVPLIHVAALLGLAVASRYVTDGGARYAGALTAPSYDTLLLVFVNIYFVGFSVAVAALGVFRREPFFVNLSIAFLALFVVAKYFDWFFEMMDRALFFIVGGTLFMLVGMYVERRRKLLVRSISE
ncbi:MAG: hypothetical protein QG650_714 [Patescibacteria group bacterium]|nr:hypothetical protein [Patescibacteria group bacterium]